MKLIQMTVTVIDFDHLGAEEVVSTLENANYPNDCISPRVHDVKVHDIGDWSDDHPLNQNSTFEEAYKKIISA
jgi:hypothetical protein